MEFKTKTLLSVIANEAGNPKSGSNAKKFETTFLRSNVFVSRDCQVFVHLFVSCAYLTFTSKNPAWFEFLVVMVWI
jgi:hypothetical protein